VRILLVTDWNRDRGGSEVYALWLRDGLRRAGDDVRLLTSSAGSAADGSADYVAYGSNRAAAQALLQIVNPWAVRRMRQAVHAFRPDAIYLNNFAYHLSPAVFWACGGVPTILGVTDYKCICPLGSKLQPDGTLCAARMGSVCGCAGCLSRAHQLRDTLRYALIRPAVRRATRVLACSAWVAKELADNGIASEHVPMPTAPSDTRPPPRLPAPDPLFVFCGRLSPEKGALLLLGAFARLRNESPHSRLRIIGVGPQQALLQRLILEFGLGDSVSFTGWLASEQLQRHLSDAWALVIPSLWAEPFGLICVQAIVSGVPVIASSCGGPGEIVEQGISGLLFPNGDEDALLERMRTVARGVVFPSHVLPREVTERAAVTYRMDRHIARLREIFEEVAGARASTS
jgi:glycosyltransferase involved in cell wall biosynthesis